MQASHRVLVNTGAQYVRTLVNTVLSLYTIRVVLSVLGESDYGIYTLIAGIIAMLAFITNSMVITTQRFVSFYQGKGDKNKLQDIFTNSLFLHIGIMVVVAIILESIEPLLFEGFLNIPENRLETAKIIYQYVIIILATTFITAPYRALLISHENIVYISIVDVLDGILKVIFAILLTTASIDKLIFYGLTMILVQVFTFLMLTCYCFWKYEECKIPRFKDFKISYQEKILSFAGWNIYTTGCIAGRQQGLAIILNRLFTTAVNAAYGIAFQIIGYINFLSASLANAITPQIVKAEGQGNRKHALNLTLQTCKFMFFLLASVCIPCIFEMNDILHWWLGEVPEHATLFCIMVLSASMADTLTLGLAYINQAIGKIALFSVLVNTPKLLTLPILGYYLAHDGSLEIAAVIYVVIELLCAIIRLPYIHYTTGMKISRFLKEVIMKEVLPLLLLIAFCLAFTQCCVFPYRFFATILLSVAFFAVIVYFMGLNTDERLFIKNTLALMKNKMFRR